jgi:alpha-D-ribose 1-methylphosphonate 5-triphosphate synthase subunit PhnH
MSALSPLSLASGFANPVFDSQSAFRRTMEALSRPGQIRVLGDGLSAETPLAPSAAALILEDLRGLDPNFRFTVKQWSSCGIARTR